MVDGPPIVTPAEAGVHWFAHQTWIPAFAGMTEHGGWSTPSPMSTPPQIVDPVSDGQPALNGPTTSDRHPRESGGPLTRASNMDSRLRGNDGAPGVTRRGNDGAREIVDAPPMAEPPPIVTLAKAGVHWFAHQTWVPAFAGMTIRNDEPRRRSTRSCLAYCTGVRLLIPAYFTLIASATPLAIMTFAGRRGCTPSSEK